MKYIVFIISLIASFGVIAETGTLKFDADQDAVEYGIYQNNIKIDRIAVTSYQINLNGGDIWAVTSISAESIESSFSDLVLIPHPATNLKLSNGILTWTASATSGVTYDVMQNDNLLLNTSSLSAQVTPKAGDKYRIISKTINARSASSNVIYVPKPPTNLRVE